MNLTVGVVLFLGAVAVHLLLSGAPVRVHVATIGSWLMVVALAALLLWLPWLKPLVRAISLLALLFVGAWFLAFATSRVVLSYELNARTYFAYVLLTAVLLAGFFSATLGISKLLRLWGGRT